MINNNKKETEITRTVENGAKLKKEPWANEFITTETIIYGGVTFSPFEPVFLNDKIQEIEFCLMHAHRLIYKGDRGQQIPLVSNEGEFYELTFAGSDKTLKELAKESTNKFSKLYAIKAIKDAQTAEKAKMEELGLTQEDIEKYSKQAENLEKDTKASKKKKDSEGDVNTDSNGNDKSFS